MNDAEKDALNLAAREARFDLELANDRVMTFETDLANAKVRLEKAQKRFDALKEHLDK